MLKSLGILRLATLLVVQASCMPISSAASSTEITPRKQLEFFFLQSQADIRLAVLNKLPEIFRKVLEAADNANSESNAEGKALVENLRLWLKHYDTIKEVGSSDILKSYPLSDELNNIKLKLNAIANAQRIPNWVEMLRNGFVEVKEDAYDKGLALIDTFDGEMQHYIATLSAEEKEKDAEFLDCYEDFKSKRLSGEQKLIAFSEVYEYIRGKKLM